MKIYYAVVEREALPSIIEWLLDQHCWFGFEPWPRNEVAVQVKPEMKRHLQELLAGTSVQRGDSLL